MSTRSIPRRAAAITAATAAVLLVLTGTATALSQAAPDNTPTKRFDDRALVISDPVPAGFTSWAEVHAAQARISAVADQLQEAAAAPDGGGFGSIIAEPESDQLRLYWKGIPPASVSALLARDTGVTVQLRPAAYTEDELQSEIDRLIAAQPASALPSADQVTGAAPLPDASGLRVFVNGSAVQGRQLPSVRAIGVPVTVEGGVTPQPASRANDSSPYWGGANWTGTGGCSTGFAVLEGGTSKMLSAGHCATDGTFGYDGGGTITDLMGRVTVSTNSGLDSLLIDTRAAGRIFNGGPGTGEFTNPVLGRHFNNAGEFVCTSGAYSGTRCNIKIVATNVSQKFTFPNGSTATWSRLALAEQQDSLNAAGNGDSGGPVFEVGSDSSTVWAKGTVTGVDSGANPATCTGAPASATRKCSWRVWYTSVAQSLNQFHAQIVTG